MRRSTITKLAPRLTQVILGIIALGFAIATCGNEGGYGYYGVNSNAYLYVSMCWACGGVVVFGALGLFAAKHMPHEPQWQLLGLIVDFLGLACGITSVTLLTVAESEFRFMDMPLWLPAMICLYLCIIALVYFIFGAVSLRSSPTTAVHQPTKDVEQPNSWYVAEQEYYRPEPVHVAYDNSLPVRKPVRDLGVKSNRTSRQLSEVETVAHWSEGSGQQTLSHPSIRSSEWRAPPYTRDVEKAQSTTYAGT